MEKRSQHTLRQILTYVESKTFDLKGLARGLGRKNLIKLSEELEHLLKECYLKKTSRGSFELTRKGKHFEAGERDEDEESPSDPPATSHTGPLHEEREGPQPGLD